MIHDVVTFCKLCQVSVVMLHSRENLQECDHCSVDLLYMTHDSFCLPLPSALCAADQSYLTFPIYHILFQIRTHIIDWQEVLWAENEQSWPRGLISTIFFCLWLWSFKCHYFLRSRKWDSGNFKGRLFLIIAHRKFCLCVICSVGASWLKLRKRQLVSKPEYSDLVEDRPLLCFYSVYVISVPIATSVGHESRWSWR